MDTGKRESFWDKLTTHAGLVGGVLIALVALFITYDVALRYFFRSPTIWVLEVSIYLIMAGTFLSFAYALKEKAHVKVDFITSHLSLPTALALEICTSLLAVAYCVVLIEEGVKVVLVSYQRGEVSPTLLSVPQFIPKLLVPLGSILLLIQLVRLIAQLLREFGVLNPRRRGGAEPARTPEAALLPQILVSAIFVAALAASLFLLKANVYLGQLVLFFVLLLSGVPVAFALGLFGLFGFYMILGGAPMLVQAPMLAYSTLDSFVMVALPLFILTSNVLRAGEVGTNIYKFANVLVRHLPGGLGIASIICCGLFASMTGSSVAVAAAVSIIALPEMLSRGYDRKLTIGVLAAGGTLGILFPPSLSLILYGAMTDESVGSLLMAGLVPGLILSGMFCLYVAFAASRDKNIPREPRASLGEIGKATREALGGLGTIVIIIGGIYSGIFTPTESGGVAAIYSIVLCVLVYRSLSAKGLKNAFLDTAQTTSMIMLIIIGANITGQVVLLTQVSQNILAFVKSMALPPWVVILAINIFLFMMGMPLEAISILVITLPILYPLVTGLGFSGLWFAVVMMINMELALISPPEGLNLFILQNNAKATASEVSRGVIPFLVIMAIFLLLVSCVPGLATWLPGLMKK